MESFDAVVKRFGQMGEKTGWYYIDIGSPVAARLYPGMKQSFRVKGAVNNWHFEKQSLLPMGSGNFIMALNADARRGIGARMGDTVKVKISVDKRPVVINSDFLDCLADEPAALAFFDSLPAGHRNYFSKWIETAKTSQTRARRIAQAVTALSAGLGFGEMIRNNKQKNDQLR